MGGNKGGSAASNNAPAHVSSALNDCASYTSGLPKKQSRNGHAPLHLLADPRLCRCRRDPQRPATEPFCKCAPKVVIIPRNGFWLVGIQNPVWGHGAKIKECLTPASAQRYRVKLLDELRALAWKVFDDRERRRELAMRERIARAGGGL
jgi:hypothetical protein